MGRGTVPVSVRYAGVEVVIGICLPNRGDYNLRSSKWPNTASCDVDGHTLLGRHLAGED